MSQIALHPFLGRWKALDEALALSGRCLVCGKGADSHQLPQTPSDLGPPADPPTPPTPCMA